VSTLSPNALLHSMAARSDMVCFFCDVEAPQYPPEKVSAAAEDLERRAQALLTKRGIRIVPDPKYPKLIASVKLKMVRECSTGIEFHLLKVESYLRETVVLDRAPPVGATADTWRHPSELLYYPVRSDPRLLERAAIKTAINQLKRFTNRDQKLFAGKVRNHSRTKALWVVETDTGSAIAHKLSPGRQSPDGVDADGVKAIDGTLISGHGSWWKVRDINTADINDDGAALSINCLTCSKVGENEFGVVTFDSTEGWGEPLWTV
jgi:hypothetical protein